MKHLSDLLNEPAPQGAAVDSVQGSDGMLHMLKEKFPILIFSCVQLSSKLSCLGHVSSAYDVEINCYSCVFYILI